jgi:GNAT superfamily N-acetyltransferase
MKIKESSLLRHLFMTGTVNRQQPGGIYMSKIRINKGYIPGSIGRIVELHGTYYHRHWGFALYFEAMVATNISGFLKRYNPSRDGFWTVTENGRVEGTVSIDGVHAASQGAHLRWFIISEKLQGKGIGRQLIDTAIDFCLEKHYSTIYLWTFEGLRVARKLYEKKGFVQVAEETGTEWGVKVKEQRLVLKL